MRALRLLAVAMMALGLLAPARALAQGLRLLHVDALAMHADRTNVAVGDDLHLTIHAHVRERITALDELVIPDVGTMHVLGDERRATHAAGGTDIDEVLTLEAVDTGAFTIPGATLDAIDARTRKPTRFIANSVRLTVGSNGQAAHWIIIPKAAFVAAVLVVCFGAVVAVVAWNVFGGRLGPSRLLAQRSAPVPQSDPYCLLPPRPADAVRSALAAIRAEQSVQRMAGLRIALFRAAGVDEGATLRDAIDATTDEALIIALRAAEAASFAPREQWPARASEAIVAADAWLA